MADPNPQAPANARADSYNSKALVWFITGCSTGFGQLIALEALSRGDSVIATARGNVSRLKTLKAAGAHTMSLDVTIPSAEMRAIAAEAWAVYGRVDVVVNNAGYAVLGPLEELGPEGLLLQFQTNVLGPQNVNCAFLPYMRARRRGTIIMIGSRSGVRVMPIVGAYGTSKAAVNAYSETLAKEISPFGVRLLSIIPGGYYTSGMASHPKLAPPFEGHHLYGDYTTLREKFSSTLETFPGSQLGDPKKFAEVVLDVVRGEGLMRDEKGEVRAWPERLFMGSDGAHDYRETMESWQKSLEDYADITKYTDRWTWEIPEKVEATVT